MHEKVKKGVKKAHDMVSRAIHYLIGEYKLFNLGRYCRLCAVFAHSGNGFVARLQNGMRWDWLFKGISERAEIAHSLLIGD